MPDATNVSTDTIDRMIIVSAANRLNNELSQGMRAFSSRTTCKESQLIKEITTEKTATSTRNSLTEGCWPCSN